MRRLLLILGAIFLLVGEYWYFRSIESVATFTLLACSTVLLVLYLFFNTYYFYIGLIALLPLSLDASIAGGAQVTVPSEAMLLMLIPVLFLFHQNFQKSILRVLKHPLTVILLIDLFIQVITTLTSEHLDVSLKRLAIRVIFLIGFFFTVTSLDQKKNFVHIWLAYAIGLIPVMLNTLRNHQLQDFNPRVVFSVCKPFFTDHTLYGACLAFIIPVVCMFLRKRKTLNWNSWQTIGAYTLFGIIIISIVLALSRAALLSVVVAIVFGLLLKFHLRFYAIVIGLVVFSGIVFALRGPIYEYLETNEAVSNDGKISNHLTSVTNIQTDASNLERVNRWICAIRMFEEKPLLGFGPGTYQFEYNKFQTIEHKTYISTNSGDKGNAHSEYLTYLSENGIFGFLIFMITVFAAIYYGMKNHELLQDSYLRMLNLGVLLGLITYFFHGIFNAFMDQSKMAFLYFAALGTIVWIHTKLQEQNESLSDQAQEV